MALREDFRFRYGVFRPLLSLLGVGPGLSRVEVDGERLRVRMGWAFRADIPLSSVTGARPYRGFVGGIGVHGWRGRWLVNGAASGLVQVDIDPPARAYVIGVPVRLRMVRLSMESPDDLLAAISR